MKILGWRRPLWVVIALSLLAPSYLFSTNAQADSSTSYMNADFAGSAYLNSTNSLEYDVTSLSNGSDNWRHLNWGWEDKGSNRYFNSVLGIDYFNSGSRHNFVLIIDDATDIQLLSGAGNSIVCDKQNPYERSGVSYFTAVCWTSYQVALGNTFRLKVLNDSTRGPTWFKATFDDLVTGAHLEIGSINAGNKEFSKPLKFLQYSIRENSNQTNCSKVGVNDTIVSAIRGGNNTLKTFSSQSLGSCINGVIVPNKNPLGGNVFKFGGTNPGARNLEATLVQNSTQSIQATRTPRPWNEVPIPAGVQRGLYSYTFDGYFNDNPSYGDGVRPFMRGTTEDQFPRFLNSGIAENTTLVMNGYFIPDNTGEWKFRIESDDASFMWLGNEAITRYRNSTQSAVIRNGGVHAPKTVEYSVNLIKDKIYPIRFMYGNEKSSPVFKFDTLAPGFSSWQSDTQGLMWHSEPSYCTTWGIGYELVGSLGYDNIPLLQQCKDLLAASAGTAANGKPAKPTFSLVNFSDNKINIKVNLGTGGSVPEKVYLVAPTLGALDSSRLQGEISENIASWSLPLEKLLAGNPIALKVVSLKNGLESDPLEGVFEVPSNLSKILVSKSVPVAPKNVKSRIIGTSAFISAEATIKTGAIATSAYVFGSAIGVTKSKALAGDLVGSKVLLEVPIKPSMAGKKLVVNIFYANSAGESQPTQAIIQVPSNPLLKLTSQGKEKVPNTVFCIKGSISRTFAATACPPGWKKY